MKLSEAIRNVANQIRQDFDDDEFKDADKMYGLMVGYFRTLETVADLIDMEGISNPEIRLSDESIKAKWEKPA